MNEIKVLLTKEVARILRLSEEYVRDLIRQGKIRAYKEGRRGGYRVTLEAVNHYIDTKHKETELSCKELYLSNCKQEMGK
jgi:excisionase family DNA binding protein